MNSRAFGVVGLFVLVLAGCTSQAGVDASAPTASSQVERSAAVGELVRDYQQARAARQWDLALSYADRLQRMTPGTALPNSVQDTLPDTSMRADEQRDHERLAKLWSYNVDATRSDDPDGALITATIGADNNADGGGDPPARLVFRNHPKWGHSASLVLEQGQFDCAKKCTVSVQFDDQPARPFAASAAAQTPNALTIDDEQTIRASLDKIRVLTVAAEVSGKPQSLSFAVGGFDRVSLERKLQ